ncbi:MAG: PilZ domain-containing protein [Desulfomonilia bacterium]
MRRIKEKRIHERFSLPNLSGSVEIKEAMQPISLINASKEGVCIAGAVFPVGSVVRLEIDPLEDIPPISLYCKVVWSSPKGEKDKKSGLFFLNTNKILFKRDLTSYSKILNSARSRPVV